MYVRGLGAECRDALNGMRGVGGGGGRETFVYGTIENCDAVHCIQDLSLQNESWLFSSAPVSKSWNMSMLAHLIRWPEAEHEDAEISIQYSLVLFHRHKRIRVVQGKASSSLGSLGTARIVNALCFK